MGHALAVSLISGESESAVVEAEGDYLVICGVSVFDEAGGESLHGNGVAGAQLGRDCLEQGLLAAEVDEPLASLAPSVGGRGTMDISRTVASKSLVARENLAAAGP
jgi:hypothetical protein